MEMLQKKENIATFVLYIILDMWETNSLLTLEDSKSPLL